MLRGCGMQAPERKTINFTNLNKLAGPQVLC